MPESDFCLSLYLLIIFISSLWRRRKERQHWGEEYFLPPARLDYWSPHAKCSSCCLPRNSPCLKPEEARLLCGWQELANVGVWNVCWEKNATHPRKSSRRLGFLPWLKSGDALWITWFPHGSELPISIILMENQTKKRLIWK